MNNMLCGRRLKFGDDKQIERLNEMIKYKAEDYTRETYEIFRCPECEDHDETFSYQFKFKDRKFFCVSCKKELELSNNQE